MTPLRLSHEILISAPAAIVWRVTTDVAQWADWSPTITAVLNWGGGPLIEGARFDLKQPLQRKRTWIVLHGARQRLTLRTVEGDLTARHELHEFDNGTLNRLMLEHRGSLGALAWPALSLALRMENAALKKRCEDQSTASGSGPARRP